MRAYPGRYPGRYGGFPLVWVGAGKALHARRIYAGVTLCGRRRELTLAGGKAIEPADVGCKTCASILATMMHGRSIP